MGNRMVDEYLGGGWVTGWWTSIWVVDGYPGGGWLSGWWAAIRVVDG
ncbi:MAG: hypothetical protein ACI30R_05190 [Sodaliphilus sp.]